MSTTRHRTTVIPVDGHALDAKLLGCPVARTAEIIANKWTPLILRDLSKGRSRFGELQRSLIGISPKTLSERLKRLEEWGLVERACFAEVPPRVEYTLTDKGNALLPIIDSMRAFGLEWLPLDDCQMAEPDEESAPIGSSAAD